MISRYPNRFANGNKFFGRHTDLPDDIERQLVSYILKMDARCFGVTRSNVRELAYEIATINGIKHRFNTEKRMTGKEWEQGFRKRHPEISLRVPEATSLNRIKSFNKSAVDRFYDLLKEIDDANQRTPDRIFNMDETGFSIVHTPSKVFAKKGRHQVRAATSAERGRNTTWVSCANASGVYVPPRVIFPRQRIPGALKNGAQAGTVFSCQSKGWINTELFIRWLDHFIDTVHETVERAESVAGARWSFDPHTVY